MDYVKGSIKNFVTLTELDCNIEIVNYETRPDIEEDDILFNVFNVLVQQVIYTLESDSNNENPIPPTPYKC